MPTEISSFGEFIRIFGGLWRDSSLGYAVRAFFQNGGSRAIIVRIYAAESDTTGSGGLLPARSQLRFGALMLEAANPGSWGTRLAGTVDTAVSAEMAKRLGVDLSDLFNLTIVDNAPGGATEIHRNLTVKDSARRVDRVLAAESVLVRLPKDSWTASMANPTAGPDEWVAATTALAIAEKLVDAATRLAAAETALTNADQAVTDAEDELKTAKENHDQAELDAEANPVETAQTALDTANDAVVKAKADLAANPDPNDAALVAAVATAETAATHAEANLTQAHNLAAAAQTAATAVTDAETALAAAKSTVTSTQRTRDAAALQTPPNPVSLAAAEVAFAKAEKQGDATAIANAKAALDTVRESHATVAEAETARTTASAAVATARPLTIASDGRPLTPADFVGGTTEADKKGLYALADVDLFNILCIPPHTVDGDIEAELVSAAAAYCEKRRAFLVIDPPTSWRTVADAAAKLTDLGTTSKNAAVFFPRLCQPNPLRDGQIEAFAPCGAIAGVLARTDAQFGVWKAPAGLDAGLVGVPALSVPVNDPENGRLNPLGINCLRTIPASGRVVWGARTRQGDDRLASEWKYIPVRRLALFIEESLYRGTHWVVFAPNDEPLWAQIRLNVGAFMGDLFRKGAFKGQTKREAYLVKCDRETTTQSDINLGVVNIHVGFAPLKPAEFVVLHIQQLAGDLAS